MRRRRCAGKRCGRRLRSCELTACEAAAGLPHHARRETRLAPRRLDVFFQEAVRGLAGIARARISPGAAFVVGGAGSLGLVVPATAPLEIEITVIAAEAVDRGFDRRVPRF